MHPNKRNFVEGIGIILKKWTALQLAVEMEWAGPFTSQKAVDLEESLIDYFEKGMVRYQESMDTKIIFTVRRKTSGTGRYRGSAF